MNINSVFSLILFGSSKNYTTFVPIINTNLNLSIMNKQKDNAKDERIFSTGELIQLGIGFGTFMIFLATVLINAKA